MRTHLIENYQALRDDAPCLSRAVTLPKATKLELGRGSHLKTASSANYTAAASQPTGRIAKAQYGISATSNIPGSPSVDLGPRKDGEQGGNDGFPLYRPLVGSLMWLSVTTRPYIANALRACARHSHNPSPRHWKALLQIAAYVNSTKEIGLKFGRGSGLKLIVFADADYAVASNDRRSVSSVAVMLGDTAIGWKISTQKCVTTALVKQSILPYAMPLRRRYSREPCWYSCSLI